MTHNEKKFLISVAYNILKSLLKGKISKEHLFSEGTYEKALAVYGGILMYAFLIRILLVELW